MQSADLRAALNALSPLPLGFFPTPLVPLHRLMRALGGPEIWIKRDDQTGLATGGNKVRKLRYLMADARRQGAGLVITAGAQQSNHARQTAAAAAQLGLECVLVLGGYAPDNAPQGNYLLDRVLGASVRWAGARSLPVALEEESAALRAQGCQPYVIPYGGSNGIGACGYVEAMVEFREQVATLGCDFDTLVFASSSGGTQAGLILGAQALGYTGRIWGISISDPAPDFTHRIAELAHDAAGKLELPCDVATHDVTVFDEYLGGGYGVVSDLEREAIALAGRTEGLLVDPVYTGRALGALIALVRTGVLTRDQRVLFWHTGGTPALFAHAAQF